MEFGGAAVGSAHAQCLPVIVDDDTGPVGGDNRGDDRPLLVGVVLNDAEHEEQVGPLGPAAEVFYAIEAIATDFGRGGVDLPVQDVTSKTRLQIAQLLRLYVQVARNFTLRSEMVRRHASRERWVA